MVAYVVLAADLQAALKLLEQNSSVEYTLTLMNDKI